MKNLMKKIFPGKTAKAKALLENKNTLRKDGLRLAQRLFGRPIRTKLQVNPVVYKKDIRYKIGRRTGSQSSCEREQRTSMYDRKAHKLEQLKLGTMVRVQYLPIYLPTF